MNPQLVAVAIFPVISNTTLGLRSVNPGLADLFRMNRATRWQTLSRMVLPTGRIGLFGAFTLALGRAFGETVAMALVAGSVVTKDFHLLKPGVTIAGWIATQWGEAEGTDQVPALFALGAILMVLSLTFSLLSNRLVARQRKAAAMRVAERVINEVLVESQIQQASSSGTAYEGDTAYPWVMRTENWPEDSMQQMTVTVSFPVQGALHEISVSTLLPNSAAADATLSTQQ